MDNAHTFCSRFNSPYNIPSKPKPEKNSSGEQSSGYVNYGSYFKNQNQEELTTTKQISEKVRIDLYIEEEANQERQYLMMLEKWNQQKHHPISSQNMYQIWKKNP